MSTACGRSPVYMRHVCVDLFDADWGLAVSRAIGNVNVNVNNLLAISESDFDNSGEPGPQAEGVNHLETPLRQLHVTHRASSCSQRGGHVQLCSTPRGARGVEPGTFQGVSFYHVLRRRPVG